MRRRILTAMDMKKAEIHTNYFRKIKPNVFDLYIGSLTEEGILERVDEFLCTPRLSGKKRHSL